MKNNMIQTIFWEKRSQENCSESRYDITFNRYIYKLYIEVSDLAYHELSKRSIPGRKKVLKTDLWDAVIDTNRNMLTYLLNKFSGDDLYGLDISYNLVEKAKIRYPKVQCKQFDLTTWENEQYKNFTFIADYSTLDHIPFEQLPKVLQFYSTALSEKGIILIIYYRKSFLLNIVDKVYLKIKKKSFYEEARQKGQFYFNDKDINELLTKQGLSIKSEKYINTLSLIPWIFWKYLPKPFFIFLAKLELLGGKIFQLYAGMRALILVKKEYGL